MQTLHNRTIFITGASRGIGREIALRFAKDGANIVIAAKTAEPHPKLPGTIQSVAQEVEEAGGNALPIQLDVRDEEKVYKAVNHVVETFGGLDILVNNASAMFPRPTLETPMKRFDLMFDCNVRATFLCSQAFIPHLKKGTNPHILNLSPPLNMDPKWFKDYVAYAMSKYGMSMCTLGMSAEFPDICINSLWPKTVIATSAIEVNFPEIYEKCRKPTIVADAAYAIVTSKETGNFFIDEEVLKKEGVKDFEQYALNPGQPLFPDLFC